MSHEQNELYLKVFIDILVPQALFRCGYVILYCSVAGFLIWNILMSIVALDTCQSLCSLSSIQQGYSKTLMSY